MRKIKISISVNSIYFSFTNKEYDKNINQTSYIETGNLIFDIQYFINNTKIISSFIKDITNDTKIESVKIKSMELVPLVFKNIKHNSNIHKLYILDNKIIDTNSFLTILDNKNLTYLNCYNMSSIMFNYLNERKDILIELRAEIKNTSNFALENKLNKYSTIYYKKYIDLNGLLSKEDWQDLESFLIINNKLQKINIKKYDLQTIKQLIVLLNKYNRSKINILIYQNNQNLEMIFKDINELKNIKRKRYNIKLIYDKDFIFKNFFKQINLSLLRFTLLIITLALILVVGITEHTYAKEDKKTTDIVENINEIVKDSNEEVLDSNTEFLDDSEQNTITETEQNKPNTNKPNAYQINYEKVFSKLKDKNKDTIGWLTVKSTKVDYPVVQAKDNDYYLKHSFDKKTNSRGWIFADYRNNFQELDDNTIIYGHNLKSGYMFGTLQKVLAPSWYNNKDNLIITFNTEKSNYSWKIFSIYTIEKNNDYLVSTFANENNFNNYIKLSLQRSIFDSEMEIKYGDNILTLSTCYIDSNHRLIIQAKLIK